MSNQMICEHCRKEFTSDYYLIDNHTMNYNYVGQPIKKEIKEYYCSEDCYNEGCAEQKRNGALQRIKLIKHSQRQLKKLTEQLPLLTKKGVAKVNKFIVFENAVIQALLKKMTKEQFREIATEMMEFAYDISNQCMCDITVRTEYVLLTYVAE